MPYTQTDLDRLKRAIASGALSIRYDDGRGVVYRSLEEMFQAKALIERELGIAQDPVRKVIAHSKGTEPLFGGGDYRWDH